MGAGTIQDLFGHGSVAAPRPADIGQQVWIEIWWDGSMLFHPNGGASLNIKQFEAIAGAQEQAPPGADPNGRRWEMIGEPGPHGGGGAYVVLSEQNQFIAPPQLLIPLVAAPVAGLPDLPAASIVHSHWLGKEGIICLTSWSWPGGYNLTAADAANLLQDPRSEASKSLLAAIRHAITKV